MADETLMTDGANSQSDAQPQIAGEQASTEQSASTDAPAQQQQTQDEQKPEGEQSAEHQGAPEQYEFKPAEGVSYDDTVIGAFSEVAKELNLPQDAAQKVLDKMAPVIAGRQAEQIAAVQTEWANTARADKEFGGQALDENLGTARRALDQFGSPELRSLLNQTGMGNHPEVIRAFYRIGKAMSDDTFVGGKATPVKSAADVLYDKSSK